MANKRVELLVERSTKHGQAGRETRSRTYLIWQSMIGRCHRPSDSSYKWYGAKGITVCDRWRKFEDFFTDMGTAPDGMHIHRTKGSTVYSKETCQWLSEHEHIGLHNKEKGWGARMNRTQLIDALAGAKSDLMRLESDWHKVVNEVLKCSPIPAKDRPDGQLEPPWEVIARIREQLADEKSNHEAEYDRADGLLEMLKERDKQLAAERSKRKLSEREWCGLVQQLREELAAEREKVETLTKALVEFENEYPHVTTLLREEYAKFHGDDYADMDAARKRILDLEDELHDEREKVVKLIGEIQKLREEIRQLLRP